MGGSEGSAGDSYTFNIVVPAPDAETGTETWTVFGAQLKSYKVDGEVERDTPPKVTTTWICYSIVEDPTPTSMAAHAVPVTTVQEMEDFSLEVSDNIITELVSFEMTVTNSYTDQKSGRNSSLNKFKTLLTDKEFECKIDFYLEEGIVVEALLLATLVQDIKIEVLSGNEEYDVTNCWMSDSPFPDYAGTTIEAKTYSVTYSGGNSVFSYA